MRDARIFKAAGFALLWGFTLALVLIWDQNFFSIMVSALGVAAALLIVFRLKWRRVVAALASALFVVNWVLAFVFVHTGGPPMETYLSGLRGAMQSSAILDGAVVLSYEVVLPLLHLITALVLSISLFRRKALNQ